MGYLYSAFVRLKQSRSATEWHVLTELHSFYLPPTRPSWLYCVSIHQMAPPERGGTHLIRLSTQFIDLWKMKGWVGLAVGLPT